MVPWEEQQADISRLRALTVGGHVKTAVGTYSMQGETVRFEGRFHWLMFEPIGGGVRNVADSPDNGRPSSVRVAAVRHYRKLVGS